MILGHYIQILLISELFLEKNKFLKALLCYIGDVDNDNNCYFLLILTDEHIQKFAYACQVKILKLRNFPNKVTVVRDKNAS